MVALPPVPKGVRLDLHFGEEGAPNVQIREFFQYTGSLSSGDAVTWLNVIMTAARAFVTSVMSNDTHLVLGVLTDLTSPSAAQVENTSGGSGGSTGVPLPNGTALVIKKVILRRYRGGHPRVYLPGMVDTYLTTTNTWDPTALATVVTDYATFIAACTGTGIPVALGTVAHVNISYYEGFTNHTYPSGRVKAIPTQRVTPLIDVITTLVGNPTVASQRRRNEQP